MSVLNAWSRFPLLLFLVEEKNLLWASAFFESVVAFPFSVSIGTGFVFFDFPESLSRRVQAFLPSLLRSSLPVFSSQDCFFRFLLRTFTLAEHLLYSLLFSTVGVFSANFRALFLLFAASCSSSFQIRVNFFLFPLGIVSAAASSMALEKSVSWESMSLLQLKSSYSRGRL